MLPRALTVLAALSAPAWAEGLRAGAAKADITPPAGFPMWGYAARKDAKCEGVRDRLHARALVVEVGKELLAIVSLDLGRAPTRESSARIRAALAKLGVGRMMLAASHTHHGPVLEDGSWPTPKAPYTRTLEDRIVAVVKEAAGKLAPARMGAASKEAPLNRNRHSKHPEAPVIRDLTVLRFESEKGEAIATVAHFAAHPTMLPVKLLKFSPDWPGALAEAVEKETKAPCLFLQGAAGDLSPNPPRGEGGPEKFGAAVAREALALKVKCEPLAGPMGWREEEVRFKPRVALDNPLIKGMLASAFYPALVAHYEREYSDGVRPRLCVATLGDVALVGVSGEVFCGHALHLKRRARTGRVLLVGLCNDYHQYFPTIEALAEGGYGTEPYISPAELGAGERLMDRALLHLLALRGKLKFEGGR
jgi:hypothetical protein